MAIHAINVRNQFRGRIKEIVLGPVVSELDVETGVGIVTSVITTRSINELGLQVGSEVLALVKATEVSIAKI
jgi:molybdopterin-binding protein